MHLHGFSRGICKVCRKLRPAYSAVVFDMDGVLIDAREWHYEALNEALGIFGASISRTEHLARFDGLPTKVKLRMLTEDKRISEALVPIIEAIKQERTLRAAARLCFPRIEHLIMMSDLKRRGLKIGVATNSIRMTATQMLSFAGIYESLDSLVTNEDVTRAKPYPDVYLLTCSNLGVDPSRVLVVEDNQYGIDAAKAAGCAVIQISEPEELNLQLLEQYLGDL